MKKPPYDTLDELLAEFGWQRSELAPLYRNLTPEQERDDMLRLYYLHNRLSGPTVQGVSGSEHDSVTPQ